MTEISPAGQKAIELARRGDFDGALAVAKGGIEQDAGDAGLRFFAGMLCLRRFDLPEAVTYLREALTLAPEDPLARGELIRALVAEGECAEAEILLDSDSLKGRDRERLRGLVAAARNDHAIAVNSYREVVKADPRDFESWGNLGISLLAMGDPEAAVTALDRALELNPAHHRFTANWADAQVAAGTAEAALERLYGLARDANALTLAARLEDLQERPDLAVNALERALELDSGHEAALAALADLHERGNRLQPFRAAVERLEQVAPHSEQLPFLRARLAHRQKDFAVALALAESAPKHIDPAARAQLIGQAHDRLGNPELAFSAFETMKRIDSLAAVDPAAKADAYLTSLARMSRTLTRSWIRSWRLDPEPPPREPAFLVGFPRSGTTLLDTLLTGSSQLAISEENPMLSEVSRLVRSFERIAEIDSGEIAHLRKSYFLQAERYVPDVGDRVLLDKFPFALGAAPLIHRLFPTAPIVLMLRHPCDVVLSCFMTRFQPSETGSAMLTLESTAKLYAAMMELWTKSRSLLPLRIHEVRYEQLVEQPEPELAGLAEFLGIDWSDSLVDNAPAARRRGFIKTPSYAQVAEPIYRRAVERWRKYEDRLRPVLPILEPWLKELGYEA